MISNKVQANEKLPLKILSYSVSKIIYLAQIRIVWAIIRNYIILSDKNYLFMLITIGYLLP